MQSIEAMARELRGHAAAGERRECLDLLGQMTTVVRQEQVLDVAMMNEFFACMRMVATWYPQIWPAALEIARAVHTARPEANTAAMVIEALRMSDQSPVAQELAFQSVHRFEITPELLVQTAAAYFAAGEVEAARKFLAAGSQHGCDLAPMIQREPTLQLLRPLLSEAE